MHYGQMVQDDNLWTAEKFNNSLSEYNEKKRRNKKEAEKVAKETEA